MNNDRELDALLKTAMDSIRNMIDANTVMGEPIFTDDGITILPISRVGFGFGTGGGEYGEAVTEEGKMPFGGGVGAGVSVKPVGFLLAGKDQVRFMPVESESHGVDRIMDALPSVLNSIQNIFGKNKKDDDDEIDDLNQ